MVCAMAMTVIPTLGLRSKAAQGGGICFFLSRSFDLTPLEIPLAPTERLLQYERPLTKLRPIQ